MARRREGRHLPEVRVGMALCTQLRSVYALLVNEKHSQCSSETVVREGDFLFYVCVCKLRCACHRRWKF